MRDVINGWPLYTYKTGHTELTLFICLTSLMADPCKLTRLRNWTDSFYMRDVINGWPLHTYKTGCTKMTLFVCVTSLIADPLHLQEWLHWTEWRINARRFYMRDVINGWPLETYQNGCTELNDVSMPDDVVRVQTKGGYVQKVLSSISLKKTKK